MQLHIVVKGRNEKLQQFLEALLPVILQFAVWVGIAAEDVTGALILTDEVENA